MSKKCPLLKMKDCAEHKCMWYQQIQGNDPQTGEPLAHWDCAINLMVMAELENAKQQHQTGAAIESFRNETVKHHKESRTAITAILAKAKLKSPKQQNNLIIDASGGNNECNE